MRRTSAARGRIASLLSAALWTACAAGAAGAADSAARDRSAGDEIVSPGAPGEDVDVATSEIVCVLERTVFLFPPAPARRAADLLRPDDQPPRPRRSELSRAPPA